MSRKWVSLTGGTWVGSSWGLETLRVYCGPGQCSPVTAGGVKPATCVRVGVLTFHACGMWLQLGSAESPVTTRPVGRCGHGLSLLQPHQAQGAFPVSTLLQPAHCSWLLGVYSEESSLSYLGSQGVHTNVMISSAPRESPLQRRPGQILRCTWTSRSATSQPAASRCSCVQMSSP